MTLPNQPKSTKASQSQFQACEIVCLEYQSSRLYAEVIQIADGRQTCWVRPLALIVEDPDSLTLENEPLNPSPLLYDLRQGSDLLLPTIFFRGALDTEVIPLLSHLLASPDNSATAKDLHLGLQQLRELVRLLCLAHPDVF